MKFRLEKLLNLALKEEESIKNELAIVRKKIADVDFEIDNTLANLYKVQQQLKEGQIDGRLVSFDVYLIKMHNNYISYLKKKKEQLLKEEEEILQKYLEKRKERMSFEKLKERQRLSELKELDRKERINIDEVSIQKFLRNTSER